MGEGRGKEECPGSFFMNLGHLIISGFVFQAVFFVALTFAHRVRCAAAIFLRASRTGQ
jgi:hypothetical protein